MGSDQHMMEGMHGHMLALCAVVALIAISSLALFVFFRRPARPEELRLDARPVSAISSNAQTVRPQQSNTRDTLFVLPDISGNTRFISLNRFAMGHAQYIIFLNAIIEATADKLELLKLEGDAALFVADANTIEPQAMGRTIVDIFHNFDREKNILGC